VAERGPRHRPRGWADIDPERQALVLTWAAFTATFILARIVTGVIKIASSSTGNVNSGSFQLHHFLWGILLTVGVAVFGLTDRSHRARVRMGCCVGIRLGLIFDEVALLVTLRDADGRPPAGPASEQPSACSGSPEPPWSSLEVEGTPRARWPELGLHRHCGDTT